MSTLDPNVLGGLPALNTPQGQALMNMIAAQKFQANQQKRTVMDMIAGQALIAQHQHHRTMIDMLTSVFAGTVTPAPLSTPSPLSPSSEPPALVAGPIVAWRLWRTCRVPTHHRLLLQSYSDSSVWFPGVPMRAIGVTPSNSSGVYAMKTLDTLRPEIAAQQLVIGNFIFGQVALWGRVIEHERGYRAQYAYPVCLSAPAPAPAAPPMPGFPAVRFWQECLEDLATTYGCACRLTPWPEEPVASPSSPAP